MRLLDFLEIISCLVKLLNLSCQLFNFSLQLNNCWIWDLNGLLIFAVQNLERLINVLVIFLFLILILRDNFSLILMAINIIILDNLINELVIKFHRVWSLCLVCLVVVKQTHDHIIFTLILLRNLGWRNRWSYLAIPLDLLNQLINFFRFGGILTWRLIFNLRSFIAKLWRHLVISKSSVFFIFKVGDNRAKLLAFCNTRGDFLELSGFFLLFLNSAIYIIGRKFRFLVICGFMNKTLHGVLT